MMQKEPQNYKIKNVKIIFILYSTLKVEMSQTKLSKFPYR